MINNFNPISILREATKTVPSVKYALGVAGIAGSLAIIKAFGLSLTVAFAGVLVMLVLMTLLVLFAKLATLRTIKFHTPVMVFMWSILIVFVLTSFLMFSSVFFNYPLELKNLIPSLLVQNNNNPVTRPNEAQVYNDVVKLKALYPQLEQLIAIYSLVAWRSSQQKRLKVTEDNNIDGAGNHFFLECSTFNWRPYEPANDGQLLDCFTERIQRLDTYNGENFNSPKLTTSYEYWYDFKWESLFGYELNVTVNPDYYRFKNLYELKEKLEVDTACLSEQANYSNSSEFCNFTVYVIRINELSVSDEVSFLVSDGYLEYASNGSVNRVNEWVVYFNNTDYIRIGALRKFIQLLLRKLQFSQTNLEEVIPQVEAKWNSVNSSVVDSLLLDTKSDKDLQSILRFLSKGI